MIIHLLRHGIAEPREAGKPDEQRALTREGKQKLAVVLKRIAKAGVEPTVIWTSPLRRALETAEVAAKILSYGDELRQTDTLLPDAKPAATWAELQEAPRDSELVLVGHEPQMSRLAAFLLGSPGLRIDLKKAGWVQIRIDRVTPSPHGVLEWLFAPRLAK
jgi:phosphohistidine phosphatase